MSRRLQLQLIVNLLGDDTLSYAYIGEAGSTPMSHPPYKKDKVDISRMVKLANQITRSLAGCDTSGLSELGSELYNGIIPEELAHELVDKKDHPYLMLFLGPELSWIPWELLWDGKMFLCHRFYVARSLQKGNKNERDEAGKRLSEHPCGHKALILFGDVSNLAAEEERKIIEPILKKVFGSSVTFRKPETSDDAWGLLKDDYELCHFIGHGVFNQESPDLTGWKFKNGSLLTCRKLQTMVTQDTFPRLIVANSCYSARSEETEAQAYVNTLYRAFLSKGVPHYIGTIARVPDDVSLTFSRSFYTTLALGKTVGEALFQARQIAQGGLGWGYYVHYGYPLDRVVQGESIVPVFDAGDWDPVSAEERSKETTWKKFATVTYRHWLWPIALPKWRRLANIFVPLGVIAVTCFVLLQSGTIRFSEEQGSTRSPSSPVNTVFPVSGTPATSNEPARREPKEDVSPEVSSSPEDIFISKYVTNDREQYRPGAWTVIIADGDRFPTIPAAAENALSEQGYAVRPLFRSTLLQDRDAYEELYSGNPVLLKHIARFRDGILVGKLRSEITHDDSLDVFTAHLFGDFRVLSARSASVEGHLTFNEIGPGVSESEANHAAQKSMADKLNQQILQSIPPR